MVDLHCHIIPNVDDGPPNLAVFFDMANAAIEAGISHLFATPHHLNGRYENPRDRILNHVNELNNILEKQNIPLTIHPGQEIRIHRELFISFEQNEVLTLDNKGKYILLELPSGEVPTYTQEFVYELLIKGVTPIIVHPERNKGFIEDKNLLYDLVSEGALTQITAGSVIGVFGKKVKSFSEKIIEHHLAHFIASDAHNIDTRGFFLNEAYETIAKTFGMEHNFYFKENAELLLDGQNIYKDKPVRIRKNIFSIFNL
jgi:protein-tyrosine phosphatase